MPIRNPSWPLVLMLLAGCSCSERQLGDDRPLPDIEGLCQTFCQRVHECGYPDDEPVEECIDECIGHRDWDDPECIEPKESIYVCVNQYECPEFTHLVVCGREDQPDHVCCPQMNAVYACRGR